MLGFRLTQGVVLAGGHRRLADGAIDTISAIDGLTTYHDWNDVVATVRAIIKFERGRAALAQINVAELDPRIKVFGRVGSGYS